MDTWYEIDMIHIHAQLSGCLIFFRIVLRRPFSAVKFTLWLGQSCHVSCSPLAFSELMYCWVWACLVWFWMIINHQNHAERRISNSNAAQNSPRDARKSPKIWDKFNGCPHQRLRGRLLGRYSITCSAGGINSLHVVLQTPFWMFDYFIEFVWHHSTWCLSLSRHFSGPPGDLLGGYQQHTEHWRGVPALPTNHGFGRSNICNKGSGGWNNRLKTFQIETLNKQDMGL